MGVRESEEDNENDQTDILGCLHKFAVTLPDSMSKTDLEESCCSKRVETACSVRITGVGPRSRRPVQGPADLKKTDHLSVCLRSLFPADLKKTDHLSCIRAVWAVHYASQLLQRDSATPSCF